MKKPPKSTTIKVIFPEGSKYGQLSGVTLEMAEEWPSRINLVLRGYDSSITVDNARIKITTPKRRRK